MDNNKKKELEQKLQMKKNQFKHNRNSKKGIKKAKKTNDLFKKISKMMNFVYNENPPEWIIEERYSSIKEKYPMLYDMICEKRVNMRILSNMFAVLEQMELKKISSDDADKYVGKQLADEYVEPVVNNTTENK